MSKYSHAVHDRPRQTSDDQLISDARSGDQSAFDQLCLRYSQRIRRVTYRITKNQADAEDALQESYLKAFLNLKRFEGRSSFSSWLTRIAINSALMRFRKRRGREVALDQVAEESRIWTWKPWGFAETPEKQCMRQEIKRLVEKAILRLPPRSREIIELRGVHERSTQEIADVLGISVPAAKTRLSRARVAVRASLGRRISGQSGDRYFGYIDEK